MNREQTSDTFDVRVDHRFTDSRTLYLRYSDNGVETLVPGVFGLVNGIDPGGSAAGFGGPSIADAWGLHANYLEIIKPTLLLEVKVGKLYFNTESLPETYGQNVAIVRPAGHQHRRPDVGPAELRGGRLHDARRPAVRADPAQEQHLAGARRRSPTSAGPTT